MLEITKEEEIQTCNLRIQLLQKEIMFLQLIENRKRKLREIQSEIQITLDEIDYLAAECVKVRDSRKKLDLCLEKIYAKTPQIIEIEQH
jgi:hypothetical protein